ncbi:MAG: hypothetical protein RhofKO_10610 [Rhodothermales bacterium]
MSARLKRAQRMYTAEVARWREVWTTYTHDAWRLVPAEVIHFCAELADAEWRSSLAVLRDVGGRYSEACPDLRTVCAWYEKHPTAIEDACDYSLRPERVELVRWPGDLDDAPAVSEETWRFFEKLFEADAAQQKAAALTLIHLSICEATRRYNHERQHGKA